MPRCAPGTVTVTAAPASEETATFFHTVVTWVPATCWPTRVQPAGLETLVVEFDAISKSPSPPADEVGTCTVHVAAFPVGLAWSEPTKLTAAGGASRLRLAVAA